MIQIGFVTRLHIVDTTLHADISTDTPDRIIGRYTRGEAVGSIGGDPNVWRFMGLAVEDWPIGMFGLVSSLTDVPVCCVRDYGSFRVTREIMESMVRDFEVCKADGYAPPVHEMDRPFFAFPEVNLKS